MDVTVKVMTAEDGTELLTIETAPGQFVSIGADVIAGWQELLGIEDPTEAVEVIMETVEAPVPADNPWPALYEAYDLKVQTEERAKRDEVVQRRKKPDIGVAMAQALPQGRMIDATESVLNTKRKATRDRIMNGKKPKTLEERGMNRKSIQRVTQGLGIGEKRKAFREQSIGS